MDLKFNCDEKRLISVIIPVYGVERWLDACLESVCVPALANAEVTGDGEITAADLTKLARKVAGIQDF